MKNITAPINNQKGISLISMMVGMVISMLTISASFIVFQHTAQRANTMKIDMQLEGQMASVFLSIQLETHSAGYGITSANAGDNGEMFAQINGGFSELYWRYYDGTAFQCRSFIETINDDGNLEMQWREATNCNGTDNLTAISSWEVAEIAAQFNNRETSLITFDVTAGINCWPYQQGVEADHVQLTVESADNSEHKFQYCITNI
ncbi:MAG: prepilin-type N-terminal cleavage/methylation domain-containing protein [Saccharospirillaceae bacterium]|nr:prepilin-type N-terminal cleavage/methylation domain-containing protein [Pseudomonadales bacterium]NRB79944.1 prepilin-type N-terminal cleavage/methylation domain-containing protein [Saccharospirillaceae bacterium]